MSSAPVASNSNKTFTVSPSSMLASNTTYNFGYICDYDVDDHNNLSNSDKIVVGQKLLIWSPI